MNIAVVSAKPRDRVSPPVCICVYVHIRVRRRVSKLVTDESKTGVMNAIGFLYVSLSSSTAQLHESLGRRWACSEAGFCSQNGDRA
jgi:hypothetical protein